MSVYVSKFSVFNRRVYGVQYHTVRLTKHGLNEMRLYTYRITGSATYLNRWSLNRPFHWIRSFQVPNHSNKSNSLSSQTTVTTVIIPDLLNQPLNWIELWNLSFGLTSGSYCTSGVMKVYIIKYNISNVVLNLILMFLTLISKPSQETIRVKSPVKKENVGENSRRWKWKNK